MNNSTPCHTFCFWTSNCRRHIRTYHCSTEASLSGHELRWQCSCFYLIYSLLDPQSKWSQHTLKYDCKRYICTCKIFAPPHHQRCFGLLWKNHVCKKCFSLRKTGTHRETRALMNHMHMHMQRRQPRMNHTYKMSACGLTHADSYAVIIISLALHETSFFKHLLLSLLLHLRLSTRRSVFQPGNLVNGGKSYKSLSKLAKIN